MTKKIKSNEKEKPLPTGADLAVPASAAVVKKTSLPDNKVGTEAKTAPSATKTNTEKPLKKDKPKKIKMIRDSFTMPESDYVKLSELKKKCLEAGVHVKKSELIRAGLLNLSKLADAALLKAIEQVEVIKTGRPVKE